MQLGEPKRRGRRFEVPVTLGVPVEALALTPRNKGFLAEVPLAVAAEGEGGIPATLTSSRLRVEIAAVPAAGTFARFQTVLELATPDQRVVFAVNDPVSGKVL